MINTLPHDAIGVIFEHLIPYPVDNWKSIFHTCNKVMLVCHKWNEIQKECIINLALFFPDEIINLFKYLKLNINDSKLNNKKRLFKFISKLGNGLQKIEKLQTSPSTLKLIGTYCHNLKKLHFFMLAQNISKMVKGLRFLTPQIETLKSLKLITPHVTLIATGEKYYPPSSKLLFEIKRFKNLTSLWFNFELLNQDHLMNLASLDKLEKLKMQITYKKNIRLEESKLIDLIYSLNKLKFLYLMLPDIQLPLSSHFFEKMAENPTLNKLKFSQNLINPLEIKKIPSIFSIKKKELDSVEISDLILGLPPCYVFHKLTS